MRRKLPELFHGAAVALVFVALLMMQGCVGWGDMFAEKRTVVGDYFLMTSEDGGPTKYFLFRKGKSGSITGPLDSIGWNQKYILVQEEDKRNSWAVFALDPQRSPIPADAVQRSQLQRDLISSIRVRSPAEVWAHGRS